MSVGSPTTAGLYVIAAPSCRSGAAPRPARTPGEVQMAIAAEMSALTREQMLQMFQRMAAIRAFETRAYELYREGVMRGTTHAYVGEEAIGVGVCAALNPDDTITSTHRGHGHCISKGGDMTMMMAELLGKNTGYCHGKGGSMHIADVDKGI